jgi:hypothetical protein
VYAAIFKITNTHSHFSVEVNNINRFLDWSALMSERGIPREASAVVPLGLFALIHLNYNQSTPERIHDSSSIG